MKHPFLFQTYNKETLGGKTYPGYTPKLDASSHSSVSHTKEWSQEDTQIIELKSIFSSIPKSKECCMTPFPDHSMTPNPEFLSGNK